MSSPLKLSNNAIGRLAGNISNSATAINLQTGQGALFPTLGVGDYFNATIVRASDSAIEIVKVTARSSDALTVVRAQETTSGIAFLAGDRIELRMTAGTFTDEIGRVEAKADAALPKAGGVMTGDLEMGAGTKIVMEGTSADAFEVSIVPGDPTADHTITLPNKTGTVAIVADVLLLDGTQTMTSDLPMGTGTKISFEGATADAFETLLGVVDPTADNTLLLPNKSDTLATLSDVTAVKQIQPIAVAMASNAATLTLNPTTLEFRSATLGSGAINRREVASAISTVISFGSTGGTVSGVASRLILLAIDNAGTVELAWTNGAGGLNLDETTLISTTAEGGLGAADSVTAIYSTTARTNVPFRVVGYIASTQATAGTWVTAPTVIQGAGGQALAPFFSLGYGQTWQSVTGSRASGTTYYNTTSKPISVLVGPSGSGSTSADVVVNGSTIISIPSISGVPPYIGSFIVPPGASYSVTYTGVAVIASWYELR